MAHNFYPLLGAISSLWISSFAVALDETPALTNKSAETSGLDVSVQFGNNPKGLKKGPDGVLYGIVGQGSNHVIYSFDPLASTTQLIYELPEDFEVTDYCIESNTTFFVVGYDPDSFEATTGYLFKILKVGNGGPQILHSTRSDYRGLSILDGNDGKLYFNVASITGGYIASIQKDGDAYQLLHDFSDPARKPLDGSRPETKLEILSGGALIGATKEGGSFNTGTLYRINKNGSGFTVVRQLQQHEPIINNFGETFYTASNGLTYGMIGYPVNFFSLDANGSNFSNAYWPGGNPSLHSNLIEADNFLIGVGLYTKEYFDANQLDPFIDTAQVNLLGWDSSGGSLVLDESITLLGPVVESDGRLYGTYRYADGSTAILQTRPTIRKVFQFSDAGRVLWGVNGAHTFHLETDGQNFEVAFKDKELSDWGGNEIGFNSSFITQVKGSMYGIQSTGSDFGAGSIFKIDSTGISRIHVLQSGESTRASLADGRDGFIYGVGCAAGCSGINLFRFNYNGDQFQQRRIVQYGMTTYSPLAYLTHYFMVVGMSSGGGAFGKGFIYKLRPDLSGIDIMHSFSGSDGKAPTTKLTQDFNGFMYGMTTTGGAANTGVIFKLRVDGTGFTKLYQFTSSKIRGVNPIGNLVSDDDNLYGVCKSSGTYKKGMIFRIRRDGTAFTNLFSFDGVVASDPAGDLILKDGVIYGSAKNKFFSIKTDGTGFTILKEVNAMTNTLSCVMSPSGEAPIVMTNPGDGSTNGYPFFSAAVTRNQYAASYAVEISDNPEFTSIVSSGSSVYTGAREEVIPYVNISNLDFSTTYYARARYSLWPNAGAVTSFTTLPAGPRLFGLTRAEGPGTCGLGGGSVFSIDPAGTTFIKHIDYSCRPFGRMLGFDLIQGLDNYVYGLSHGIDQAGGELFRFDQKGNFTSVVPNLDFYDPALIMMASDQQVYILNPFAENGGIFFNQLLRVNTTEPPPLSPTTFHDFTAGDGPDALPVNPGDGYLYGILSGNQLYRLNLNGGAREIQFIFSAQTGAQLADGHDGFLYGDQYETGHSKFFKIRPNGADYEVFFNLPDSLGDLWTYTLVGDTIYGVTSIDWDRNVFFKMSKNGQGFFANPDWPSDFVDIGDLVSAGNGYLYTLASSGGSNELGFIARTDLNGNNGHVVHDFTAETGGYALGKLLLVDPSLTVMPGRKKSPYDKVHEITTTVSERTQIVRTFPNPFTTSIQIERTEGDGPCEVVLTDLNGKVLEAANLSFKQKCAMGSTLSAGFYLVKIRQGNDYSVFKIVKQ